MAKTNLERFIDLCNRGMGGIPGKAARQDQRVADDKDIADLPRTIFNYPLPWFGYDGKTQTTGRKETTLAAFLGWIDSGLNNISRGLGEIKGSIDALTVAVLALTQKQTGIDQDALNKAMQQAVISAEGNYQFRKVEDAQ